jgi:hypothetical protein
LQIIFTNCCWGKRLLKSCGSNSSKSIIASCRRDFFERFLWSWESSYPFLQPRSHHKNNLLRSCGSNFSKSIICTCRRDFFSCSCGDFLDARMDMTILKIKEICQRNATHTLWVLVWNSLLPLISISINCKDLFMHLKTLGPCFHTIEPGSVRRVALWYFINSYLQPFFVHI